MAGWQFWWLFKQEAMHRPHGLILSPRLRTITATAVVTCRTSLLRSKPLDARGWI